MPDKPANLRNCALLTCIAFASGRLQPLWDATRTMVAVQSANPPSRWWIVPAIALAWLFSATMPVFYFTLYRNRGVLHYSKHLRRLGLMAALVFGAMVAIGLPDRIESPRPLAAALDLFSNLAYILFLIALFRQADAEPSSGTSVSRPLRVAAKVVVIVDGLWVAYNAVQFPAHLQTGAWQSTRTLLNQVCLFIGPYIVYRAVIRNGKPKPD